MKRIGKKVFVFLFIVVLIVTIFVGGFFYYYRNKISANATFLFTSQKDINKARMLLEKAGSIEKYMNKHKYVLKNPNQCLVLNIVFNELRSSSKMVEKYIKENYDFLSIHRKVLKGICVKIILNNEIDCKEIDNAYIKFLEVETGRNKSEVIAALKNLSTKNMELYDKKLLEINFKKK